MATLDFNQLTEVTDVENDDYYLITRAVSGSRPFRRITGFNFLSALGSSIILPDATELQKGVAQIATQSDVDIGTNDAKFITPDKLRNATLATETIKSVTQLATQLEYFNTNNAKTVTAENIYNDVRHIKYSIGNNTTIPSVVPPEADPVPDGGALNAGYNLLTNLLEVNETLPPSEITYKNISNVTQSTLLDETNNKIVLPSELYTYNNTREANFGFRVRLSATTNAAVTGNVIIYYIRIIRSADNTIVDTIQYQISDVGNNVNLKQTFYFADTFIKGEGDPYVNDGFYIDIIKDPQSTDGAGLGITNFDLRIFRR